MRDACIYKHTIMEVKTVFQVNHHNGTQPDTYSVEAIGQEAAEAIKLKRGETKVLKGFMINDKFVKVDLTSQWQRTGFVNGK
jgi:hypothetical protein